MSERDYPFIVSEQDVASQKAFFDALKNTFDLSKMKALDMFAHKGKMIATHIHEDVKSLELWDIEDFSEDWEKFNPVRTKVGCSYKLLKDCDDVYDLVVLDAPQLLHMNYAGVQKVEYFDLLASDDFWDIVRNGTVLVFYINHMPYRLVDEPFEGYNEVFDTWMRARSAFYEVEEPGYLKLSDVFSALEKRFDAAEYDIGRVVAKSAPSDVTGCNSYVIRLAVELVQ